MQGLKVTFMNNRNACVGQQKAVPDVLASAYEVDSNTMQTPSQRSLRSSTNRSIDKINNKKMVEYIWLCV